MNHLLKQIFKKTYYTLTSGSKYTAKWWVEYSDENGETKSKGFPVL